MDWLGSVLLLLGVWFIGSKNRLGFVSAGVGEVCWAIYGMATNQAALLTLSIIFAILNAVNFYRWTYGKRKQ